ncbi:MAG TPA: nicotinate-nucleotide adenylyltransferase [Allosphingosinicella sp.]
MILTGLLGGSFNPAHQGHRAISLAAIEALGLEEMWWLVSPGNPLKPAAGMAPLRARFASALRMAGGTPIKVTAIEEELGTRYTHATLKALIARYPERQFVWLMGADNLSQFHLWKNWQAIAKLVPIAVIGRPGYDAQALTAPAMGWLRRFVLPADQAKAQTKAGTDWSLPTLVLLNLPPDPTSASAIRAAEPNWHETDTYSFDPESLHDGVTRRLLR